MVVIRVELQTLAMAEKYLKKPEEIRTMGTDSPEYYSGFMLT